MYGCWDGRRWDGGDGRTKDGRTKDGRTKDAGTKDARTKDARTEPHLLEYLIYDCYFLSKHENCSCEFLPCRLFYSSTHFNFYLF